MPTYEYQCTSGHSFEQFQRISARPVGKCPECGAKASRVISGGAGLIFKGSGFYITDYGKDGKGPRKEGGEGGDAAAGSGDKKPGADQPAEAKAPGADTKAGPSDKAASSKSGPSEKKGTRGKSKAAE